MPIKPWNVNFSIALLLCLGVVFLVFAVNVADHYAEVQTTKHSRSITISCRDGADPTVVWPPAVDGQLEVSCGK